MGRLREFWCWLADWALWPTLRGFGIATVITLLLMVIALITYLVRRLL